MWKRRLSPSLQTTATPISPAASIRNWHVPPICGHNLPPLPPQVVLPLWLLFVKNFYVHEVVKFSAWSFIFLCCAWSCIFFASFFSAGNASWQARQSRQPDWFAKIEASPSAAINPRHFFSAGKCIDGSHMLPFSFGHGLILSENLLRIQCVSLTQCINIHALFDHQCLWDQLREFKG